MKLVEAKLVIAHAQLPPLKRVLNNPCRIATSNNINLFMMKQYKKHKLVYETTNIDLPNDFIGKGSWESSSCFPL